jgi:WhiB family redox-sensing transcriptional regulator
MNTGVINKNSTWLSSSSTQAIGRTLHRMRMSAIPVTYDDFSSEWRQDAACIDRVGEVDFFPARGESTRDAKAVCAGCPVQKPCLEYALQWHVLHGVWGGLSERERRQLRRDRRRAERALN